MKALLLSSGAAILSAALAYPQGPPAPPVTLGVVPETRAGTEQTVVTGFVGTTADGSPVIRAGEREYELPPAQQSMLLPHVDKKVKVVGTEQQSERGRRMLLVDYVILFRRESR